MPPWRASSRAGSRPARVSRCSRSSFCRFCRGVRSRGLGGVEPQKLWGVVLIFAGLSFAGYIALRLAGPERGYSVAGLLGGLVSSTVVTFNFARESRREPADSPAAKALALGVVSACTILPLRVGLVAAAFYLPVGRALAPALVLPFVAGAIAIAYAWFRRPQGDGAPRLPENPLRLGAAIQMALLFQLMLWVLQAVRDRVGCERTGGELGLPRPDRHGRADLLDH